MSYATFLTRFYSQAGILILAVFLLAGVSSCKKLDLAPSDRFTELTFWQVDENVLNAVNNIYASIYSSNAFFYNEGMSDNAFNRAGNANTIASGNFTTALDHFKNNWGSHYGGIKSCNIFLGNIEKNTTLNSNVRNRITAEVRFVRAWHHFILMKWWGDVPLLDREVSVEESKTISRTPKATVLQFILDELTAVATALPKNTDYATNDRGRVTKGAALALKARVLLYEGNRMEEVSAICEQLMNQQAENGSYSLLSNYADIFTAANEYNSEVIFDLQYVPNYRMWSEYFDFAPISAGARVNSLAPSQELVNDYIMLNGKGITEPASGYDVNDPYANRDPRLKATIVYDQYPWVNANGSTQTIYIKPGSTPSGQASTNEYSASGQGTPTGYFWRKYWDREMIQGFNSGLNLILIRYADVLLMYAEAKQSLGQMTEDVWDKTIRALRVRAGFTDANALAYPAASEMQTVIRRERRAELAFEGLRVDDIRRWKIAETVMNGWLHGAQYGDPSINNGYLRVQLRNFDLLKHYLWPVPASERALNTNLSQNPGYQD